MLWVWQRRAGGRFLRRPIPASAPGGQAGRQHPRLLLAQAWMALVGGQVEAAGPALDAAERAFTDATDEPFEPSASKAASLLVNVPAGIALGRASLAQLRGDADGTAAFASQTLAKTGEGESMLDSTARWLLAMAEWLRGRVAEAERVFAAFLIATGGRGLVHTRNRGNQPLPQAAAQQRGGCPEPGTHLQAVLHRLAPRGSRFRSPGAVFAGGGRCWVRTNVG
jgi:LuxR family transcriptional regulator, maltose regulon positive regulatory protein